jgi:hypothetical protein
MLHHQPRANEVDAQDAGEIFDCVVEDTFHAAGDTRIGKGDVDTAFPCDGLGGRIGQSGIIEGAPEFDALAAGGGLTVEMPFWKDLTADRQVLSDSGSLAINKITSDKDIARIQRDGQTWGVNDLAKAVSGDDPM